MKKKGFTRIFASYLMAAVIAGQTLANCAPLTVYASEKPTEKQLENKKAISQPITAYASKEPTEKEEVVYAILDSSGKVEKIEVVNSFCAQDIVDYGNYTTIKNLTTTDSIEQDGDRITCHTDAEKFYYQGSMENGELPWDIAISYKLDGKECSADELAGKDGALEIQIKVTQNKDCDESFWNGYALQASLTLDTALCKNIEANGATIANVGSDKQLSYIILPGQGADLSIKADVHDFEMEAVSINGMRLSMDFDFNTGELTDKIKEVQDAIKSLNDGSGELSDGTKTLQSGAKELYDGSVSVNDGATTLNDGVVTLNKGISTMRAALDTLSEQSGSLINGSGEMLSALQTMQSTLSGLNVAASDLSALAEASAQTKAGIDTIATLLSGAGTSGIDLSGHDSLISELNSAINSGELSEEQAVLYNRIISTLEADKAAISGFDGQIAQAKKLAITLQDNYALFDTQIQSLTSTMNDLPQYMMTLQSGINMLTEKYRELDQGINAYTDAVSQLSSGFSAISSGAASVVDGTAALYKGTGSLMNGLLELYNGTGDLQDGTTRLHDGTDKFYEEIDDADSKIDDMVNEKIGEVTGENVETISFVSSKNTDIDSVLFVIKTPAVEIAEDAEDIIEEDNEPGFFEKFLNLFR